MLNLILIRGLPGSGKTTLAKELLALPQYNTAGHFEADMYFTSRDGTYKYNPKALEEAHSWCQNQTEACLTAGQNVIVSNCFVLLKHMIPYIEMAGEYRAALSIYQCFGKFGSIHNVPENTMKSLAHRWQSLSLVDHNV